ncbi:T9SS type A sorting domain-containing protein [Dokdonia ponticola]|uniref:T9SS type A sorting domain-containing protein n=1 Tax=Dokdonia ponticola TaxID=2041041 RepID=A0ABV9HQN8_9FLAO
MRVLLFCFLLFYSFINYAQDAWTQLNDFPFEAYSNSSFVIEGEAYVAVREGINQSNSPSSLYKYTSSNDSWEFVAAFPSSVLFLADPFVIDDRVFFIGLSSNDDISELWEFGIVASTWEQRTGYPFVDSALFGYHATAFTISGLGYVIGITEQEDISNFASYDPETDSWTERAPFLGPNEGSNVGFVLDSNGYILFGSKFKSFHNDLWKYDPITDQWEQKESIPENFLFDPAVFVIQDQAYVGLGLLDLGILNTIFRRYNPINDSWEAIESPQFQSGTPFGFTINDIGYVGVGYDDPFAPNTSPSNEIWRLDPELLSVTDVNTTEISLYPNPATDVMFIESALPIQQITVYNVLGQAILTERIQNNQLDVSSLSKGIYLVKLTSDAGIFTQRLVKD